MNGTTPQDPLTHLAPAKLNLRLKITGRRPDGYHDLVSVMVPVAMCDQIEIRLSPRPGVSMTCQGLSVPDNEENLAFRAAKAFCAEAGFEGGLHIHLIKNIPVAAGLGGGSSDAAAVLQTLNRWINPSLTSRGMEQLALGLGADVPFFLKKSPCIARGIGERLTSIEKWPDLWYVIIVPCIEVSTAWVYGQLDRIRSERKGPWNTDLELTTIEYQGIIHYLGSDLPRIGPLLENDLEPVTAAHFPVITRIKAALSHAGAEGALMSGSGPSVFGVYRSEDRAKAAKELLTEQDLGSVFLARGLEKVKHT
ncbi:MAG: 4-(cytidine 5'-diphospho)-2-C-methyl-D-erythritol kinase [Deltaproteobacteria bacterium]|nr:4-(cytidine 5'-diphospho)-2-C-methyl-D-erythritol kinase [Deltaproteobacteria bacterium]